MTFWDRLQKSLHEKNLTVADLSRNIGIAQSSINSWKSKGSIPRADVAVKTAQTLGTSVEWLVNGNSSPVLKKDNHLIPVLDQSLSAGNGSYLSDSDTPKGLLELPSNLLKEYGNNLAALYVKGDSMEPTLHNGDLIVCDSLGWDSGEGVYAIRLNGNGYVKRLQVGDGKIYICSDNPKYKTIEEPIESENFQIIGKVRFVGTVRI